MVDEFRIQESQEGGRTVVLRVAGRLDAKSAPTLTQCCTEVRTSGQNVVLNLAGVTFIASSGLGALLSLAEEFRQAGRSIRFVSLSAAVTSVIQLLNLDQFLAIDATEEEALRALAV